MNPQNSFDAIISTLPINDRWVPDPMNPLYLYHGHWYPKQFFSGAIAAQNKSFSPSATIIACNPKCGTTWLTALTFAITTRARFPQSDPNNPLNLSNPHELIPMIETGKVSEHGDLNIFYTHLPYTMLPTSIVARGCKIVYIWRDPKDAFVSRWHMANKMRANQEETGPIPVQEACDLFCNGVSHFGPFWDHVLGYRKAFLDRPNDVLFLKYDDMMDDGEVHVKKLADFIGYPFAAEEEENGVVSRIVQMCSFEKLSNLEVNKDGTLIINERTLANNAFFRKGKVGDWINYLTPEMAAKIDQITLDKLGSSSGLIN